MSFRHQARSYSSASESEAEDVDDQELVPTVRGSTILVESPTIPPSPQNENMTGALVVEEPDDPVFVDTRAAYRPASTFSFPRSEPSSSQAKPTTSSQAKPTVAPTALAFHQQKRTRREPTPPPEEIVIKAGHLFDLLTDTSRIAISGGDGSQDFVHTLSDTDFDPILISNLREIGFVEPTAVQKAVWHVMLNKYRFNLMTQAQTGSGKTFAFLVPLIQNVLKVKDMFPLTGRSKAKNAPFAVIFVPTRELVFQVMENAKHLTKNLSVDITHGTGNNSFIKSASGKSDIHITTMGGLMNGIDTNPKRPYPLISLDNVYYAVFDEADKYFYDLTTRDQVKKVVEDMKEKSDSLRIFAFSATLTDTILEFMPEGHFRIEDVHGFPVTIEHHTIILEKTKAIRVLLSLLEKIKAEHGGQMPKTLVFVNRRVTCDILALHLQAFDYSALALTSKYPTIERQKISKSFIAGETKILVCSDVLCPGVDWNVDVVINYHLPPAAHFHRLPNRIGRTGRAGNKGKAYSFFYNHDTLVMDQVNPEDFASFLIAKRFPVPPRLLEYRNRVQDDKDDENSECEMD